MNNQNSEEWNFRLDDPAYYTQMDLWPTTSGGAGAAPTTGHSSQAEQNVLPAKRFLELKTLYLMLFGLDQHNASNGLFHWGLLATSLPFNGVLFHAVDSLDDATNPWAVQIREAYDITNSNSVVLVLKIGRMSPVQLLDQLKTMGLQSKDGKYHIDFATLVKRFSHHIQPKDKRLTCRVFTLMVVSYLCSEKLLPAYNMDELEKEAISLAKRNVDFINRGNKDFELRLAESQFLRGY
ncbi:hypothetical protein BT69DRAFT_1322955 [Atractiella rhizophila]|nr:hypothetical protein BT69DRAFT_1322955 [Atractiella rhizophila]